uniref:Uncharacterized protein n=1 Tax=Cacopsylla melanoneura TaxID=428564 RepID=A0A8D9F3Z0_9HEMI
MAGFWSHWGSDANTQQSEQSVAASSDSPLRRSLRTLRRSIRKIAFVKASSPDVSPVDASSSSSSSDCPLLLTVSTLWYPPATTPSSMRSSISPSTLSAIAIRPPFSSFFEDRIRARFPFFMDNGCLLSNFTFSKAASGHFAFNSSSISCTSPSMTFFIPSLICFTLLVSP